MQLAAHPRTDGRRSMTASIAVPQTQRELEKSVLVENFDAEGEQIHRYTHSVFMVSQKVVSSLLGLLHSFNHTFKVIYLCVDKMLTPHPAFLLQDSFHPVYVPVDLRLNCIRIL